MTVRLYSAVLDCTAWEVCVQLGKERASWSASGNSSADGGVLSSSSATDPVLGAFSWDHVDNVSLTLLTIGAV